MKAKELAEMLLARPEADVVIRHEDRHTRLIQSVVGADKQYPVERVDVPYVGPLTLWVGTGTPIERAKR
jgi:hypothetical protein